MIGVNGYANGVDAFVGLGDTIIRDSNSSHTLNFSTTALTDIAEVDAAGGNDVVATALSSQDTDGMLYDGGAGNDKLQITLTTAQAQNSAILADIAAYQVHFASTPGTVYNFATLGFSAINFELAEALVQIGMFAAPFDNVIIGTGGDDTITPTTVTGGVTGNPPPTSARDLIFGNNYNDTIDGGGGNDIIIGAHGNDDLSGNAGNDFFVYIGSNNGSDIVDGGTGTDTIVAASDNTVIGLASGFANGVEIIDALNKTGVQVQGTGGNDTLDFSGVTFQNLGGDFEVNGGNYNDEITTSNMSAVSYRGAHGNDTFHIGDADATFLYSGTNNGADSFTGNDGDQTATILAETDGTVIGLASGFANGVDIIDGGNHSNVEVQGTGGNDTLDFSGVTFQNLGGDFEVNGGNYNDEITTSNMSAVSYRGAHGNDTFHIGDADATFLYSGTNNGADSFTGNDGDQTATILAGADNTVIGLASGFANGVDIIDGGNHSNVEVQGTGGNDTLDFSGVTFQNLGGDFEVNGGNYNDEITTSNMSAVSYRGAHGNDTFHIGDADATFLYSGTNNGADSFTGNDGDQTATILTGADNTVIGLASGFVNGVDIIDGGNHSNVEVQGTGGNDTLDFSGVTFQNLGGDFEVNGGNYNDEITTSNMSAVSYRGAHGNDTFHIGDAGRHLPVFGDEQRRRQLHRQRRRPDGDHPDRGRQHGDRPGVGLRQRCRHHRRRQPQQRRGPGHGRQRHARFLRRDIPEPGRRLRGQRRQLQRRDHDV